MCRNAYDDDDDFVARRCVRAGCGHDCPRAAYGFPTDDILTALGGISSVLWVGNWVWDRNRRRAASETAPPMGEGPGAALLCDDERGRSTISDPVFSYGQRDVDFLGAGVGMSCYAVPRFQVGV